MTDTTDLTLRRKVRIYEAALKRIASPDELTGDGPLEPILANPTGTGEHELRARMRRAADALQEGQAA